MKDYIINCKSELKASDDETGVIEGYASVFGGIDSYNDTIEKTAYDNVLKSNILPRMFFNHSHWDLPIGKWEEMTVDDTGLYMKGKLNLNLDEGKDVYEAVKFGSVDGLSIGFRMDENGATYDDDGVRHIHNVKELLEVSIVTFPADKSARISDVKSALEALDGIKEFERFLRDAGGFSRSEALALIAKARKIFGPLVSESPKEEDINLDPAIAAMRKLNSVLRGN